MLFRKVENNLVQRVDVGKTSPIFICRFQMIPYPMFISIRNVVAICELMDRNPHPDVLLLPVCCPGALDAALPLVEEVPHHPPGTNNTYLYSDKSREIDIRLFQRHASPEKATTLCGRFMCKSDTFVCRSISSYLPWAIVTMTSVKYKKIPLDSPRSIVISGSAFLP